MSYPRELAAGAMAGAISGFSTDLAFLPFDTLRANLNYGQSQGVSANPLTAMRQVGTEMIAAGGIFSLFRGTTAVMLLSPPVYGVYFGTYRAISKQIERHFDGPEHTPGWAYLVAGLNAEVFALGLFLPYDVCKQRLQLAPMHSREHVFSVMREVVATSGISGLYRGALASMATYAPFSALYFASYEQFKRLQLGPPKNAPAPTAAGEQEGIALRTHAAHFSSAIAAGAVSAAATQPIDVLKTRIQVGDIARTGNYDRTLWGTLRAALAHGGPRSLLRGTLARVLAIAPGCGCSMMIFEMVLPSLSGSR
jgi:solute carrier family 25 iron transporter 28/37